MFSSASCIQQSNIACLPSVRWKYIQGNTVFVDHKVPRGQNAYIQVTPDGTHDLTLYVLQEPAKMMGTNKQLGVHPPNVEMANGCVKSYYGKPGQPEKVKIGQRPDEQTLVIAIAGVKDVTAGGYKLEIWNGE